MSLTTNIDNIFKKGVIGNVRKAQEDSHDMALKTPNGDVFVVCDGMGGHVGGAKASSLAVESIITYLKKEEYPHPIEALNGALQFANTQILGFAAAHPEYKGMGTTACIVLMKDIDVWIAHVGDSRIYLYLGVEKKLHRITKDHSFVQTLVDAGEITDDEAEHHPNKNRILKALGVTSDLQPTFNHENLPIHPKNGDIFLICTDGLCGMISDNTIETVLEKEIPLEEKGELLIRLAMEGEITQPGGQDNCTLELIEVDKSPWQKSEFKSFNPSRKRKKNHGSQKENFPKRKFTIVAFFAALLIVAMAVALCWKPAFVSYYEHQRDSLRKEATSLKEKTDKSYEKMKDKEKKFNQNQNKGGELERSSKRLYEETKKTYEQNDRELKEVERKITDCEEHINQLKNKKQSNTSKKSNQK